MLTPVSPAWMPRKLRRRLRRRTLVVAEVARACRVVEEPLTAVRARILEALEAPAGRRWWRKFEAQIDALALPRFTTRQARRVLFYRWGPPNAFPRAGEKVYSTRRVLFVDDRDGFPVAIWEPSAKPADLVEGREKLTARDILPSVRVAGGVRRIQWRASQGPRK